jgi:hypothetical protein
MTYYFRITAFGFYLDLTMQTRGKIMGRFYS